MKTRKIAMYQIGGTPDLLTAEQIEAARVAGAAKRDAKIAAYKRKQPVLTMEEKAAKAEAYRLRGEERIGKYITDQYGTVEGGRDLPALATRFGVKNYTGTYANNYELEQNMRHANIGRGEWEGKGVPVPSYQVVPADYAGGSKRNGMRYLSGNAALNYQAIQAEKLAMKEAQERYYQRGDE